MQAHSYHLNLPGGLKSVASSWWVRYRTKKPPESNLKSAPRSLIEAHLRSSESSAYTPTNVWVTRIFDHPECFHRSLREIVGLINRFVIWVRKDSILWSVQVDLQNLFIGLTWFRCLLGERCSLLICELWRAQQAKINLTNWVCAERQSA